MWHRPMNDHLSFEMVSLYRLSRYDINPGHCGARRVRISQVIRAVPNGLARRTGTGRLRTPSPVLQVVHRVITRHLLGQARLKADVADSGAVTLIQRFGSAANLNIRLHCLVLDGVYRRGIDGAPEFVEVPEPTDEARTLRPLQAAACTYRIAFGPRAGQKVLTVQGVMPRETDFKQTLCADVDGFSLHAAVRCGADDRETLEQLCRYITRPALANERVQTNSAGHVALKLKTPCRQCNTHMVMSTLELIQRLAALIPRRRQRPHQPTTALRTRISAVGCPLRVAMESSAATLCTGRNYAQIGSVVARFLL